MKKVTSILAVTVFTLNLFTTNIADDNTYLANFENAIACGDCDNPINDDRGN